MSWTVSSAYKDPNFSNVTLLVQGDGANNTTVFTDKSLSSKIVTRNGDAKVVTGVADPFGLTTRGVISFDGSGDYLSLADSSDFDFGANDFTVEFWVNLASTAGLVPFISKRDNQGLTSPFFLRNNEGKVAVGLTSGGGWTISNPNSIYLNGTIATGSWNHIALTRNGSTFNGFLNGTITSVATSSSTLLVNTANLYIGGDAAISSLSGYMSNIRITKGLARYSANFPVPPGSFPSA